MTKIMNWGKIIIGINKENMIMDDFLNKLMNWCTN